MSDDLFFQRLKKAYEKLTPEQKEEFQKEFEKWEAFDDGE